MIQAAGLLVYRKAAQAAQAAAGYEVLLVHPGGPFWANKDVWSIPKGELEDGETPLQAMEREFREEIGIAAPRNNLISLGDMKQGSKVNHIWAAEGDIDLTQVHCDSMVTMEWPPRSGKTIEFPENDRAKWMELPVAREKVYGYLAVFIERLAEHLHVGLAEIIEPTNSTLF